MPTPDWARCHVEIYEAPGWLDDCFRSSLWILFHSASSQSFANAGDVSGDLAVMTVTEGVVVNGCGYRKDISGLNLSSDDYPRLRVRLRGRGTTPKYKIGVEYTDASSNETGWLDAPADMVVDVLPLLSGKIIKYVKLYVRCNTALGTAYVDWDYAVVVTNPPLIPTEAMEVDVDLWTTSRISGATLKLLNDHLLGVTARRYMLDEGEGLYAFDLSRSKGHADLVNTSWISGGVHGKCLYFNGVNARMETGYKTTIPATGVRTIACWVKAAPGVSGIICGFGKVWNSSWSRIQFNWSSDRVRLYVRDDAGNVRQYTSSEIVANNGWHLLVGVIDPGNDLTEIWIDAEYDGGASGALGQITVDTIDLTWGCLNNNGVYSEYTACYVDEPQILERALQEVEIMGLFKREPPSGAARAASGNIVMIYLAAHSENQVYKVITARVIDRVVFGDPDEPVLRLVLEDLGEIMHERTFTKEYAMATQISLIVDDVSDDSLPELFHQIDATNRTLVNKFNLENVWSLLQKLAETAKFATGETGANFYVDPGGALRFKKYGAWTAATKVSDGSDGNAANILDIQMRETMKGEPKLVNDVRVVIFEEEALPRDEDSLTESVEGWSSPDPTDGGYPQSDTGDYQAGTASVHFNTTNPGTQYRMRCEFSELDISGFDSIKFLMKYGASLSVDSFEVRIWRGGWLWVTDYLEKTGITPQGSGAWHEYTVDLSGMSKTGNPGNIIKDLRIRVVHSVEIGTGGVLIARARATTSPRRATRSPWS